MKLLLGQLMEIHFIPVHFFFVTAVYFLNSSLTQGTKVTQHNVIFFQTFLSFLLFFFRTLLIYIYKYFYVFRPLKILTKQII